MNTYRVRFLLGSVLALVCASSVQAGSPPTVDVRSRAALVVRADTGAVLYRKNADQPLPIASITKLMTAMVVLDAKQSLEVPISITNAEIDRLRSTTSRLAIGTRLPRGDLLRLALMSSENRAAAALLRNYPGGQAAGVAAMNRKASALGMRQTRFVEATGLSGENRASPADLVRMVRTASTYPTIRSYSTTREYTVKVGSYATQYRNTNPLVRNPQWHIDITKTGFLNEAGRCLVMQATIDGKPVVMVLMDSVGSLTRIGDANRVRRWLEASAHSTQASARN
ncbi:D-alanyl-D-alanine endopeptidase [Immundisolibacter sp.]|uniref:D-alanyl-D-alanine endopeptidase n=1 Tax=Immundisolibacter sp. TaxID=1934948 RepID=UPI003561AC08